MKEPIIIQILRLIRDEGPLSAKNIRERLDGKRGTVYPLISILRELGLVEYFKGMDGIYTVTSLGKEALKKIDEKQSR